MTDPSPSLDQTAPLARIVVATTVLLSFISFWRAAAIVLNDLASSAYYAGGIAEHHEQILTVAIRRFAAGLRRGPGR